MKHLLSILFLVIITSNSQAQNVGIGTTTPEKPLTIKTNGMGVSQESNDGTAKVGFYTATNTAFIQTHSSTDLNFSTNNGTPQMTLQKTTGNVGIGTATPTAKLDVNGRLQTSAGANLGGDVDILGNLQTQGSVSTDASLFVSDNATINGTVKIAGGSPGVGKVLTSDAAGNASWKSNAYGNMERFQYKLTRNQTDPEILTTSYNYGTTSATNIANTIIINFPSIGLYHFDLNGYFLYQSIDGVMLLNVARNSSTDVISKTYGSLISSVGENSGIDKSFDIYIQSGESIRILFGFDGGGGVNGEGFRSLSVTGHKIAD